jgi:hypothetical protein
MLFNCDRCELDVDGPLHPYRKYWVCDRCSDILGVDR